MGRSQHQRHWGILAGVTLVVAGIAVLGYVAWAVYGTTWASHRTQAHIVDKVHDTWGSAPATDTTAPKDDAVEVPQGDVTALLRIPRFGDNYVMPVLEGTTDEVLAAGVGHYPTTAGPGEHGNYALAAHRITHGEPFRHLPDLQPGDLVHVETPTHVYTYKMLTGGDDLEVTFDDAWVLAPDPDNPDTGGLEPPQQPDQRLLTLTTCADLFHSDNRLVAFGILIDTESKDPSTTASP